MNISPQNFVVNVNPPSVPYAPDVDSLLDGIELKDLMYLCCLRGICSHLFLCCHILSGISITLINMKPHPGGYEYCPADLAVTVAVQLLL